MLKSPVMTMSHWLTEGCRRMSSSDCMKFVLFESGGLYIVPTMIGLRFVFILTQVESIVKNVKNVKNVWAWKRSGLCAPLNFRLYYA